MREIRLYGELGKKFGKSFILDVKNAGEAIRALKVVVKGFAKYMSEHSKDNFHIFIDKQDIDKDELDNPVGTREIIKIVPAIGGSGGLFKIVIGAILVVALWNTPYVAIGWSMIASGVSEILFAPPKPNTASQQEKVENKPSYVFDGPVNTTAQGHCVPVAYGQLRVGSQVISAGLFAEALAI